MINKKYVLLAGVLAAIAVQPAFAQESSSTSTNGWSGRDMTYRGYNYDYMDTAYVPKYRMKQQSKFLANQYAFPAKPRNMWEVGAKFGLYNISGDVPSLMLWNGGSWGAGAHVRKSLGYVFSTRLDYTYGIAKGLGWKPSQGYETNTAWRNYYNSPADLVFYNYRTEVHQLSLDLIASTNNIRFHRAKTGVSFYGFLGLSAIAYATRINALDANYASYATQFNALATKYIDPAMGEVPYKDRNKLRSELKDILDDSYETDGESSAKNRRPGIFDKKTALLQISAGMGAQFRLSQRFNIAIEDRLILPIGGDDLLDGHRWAEQTSAQSVLTQSTDLINFFSVGLNYNIGNKRKSIEPLYWVNPLDYSYTELNAPRHMKLPDPVIPDADGDGIADQMDKCPGTPAGVAVDTHGCPLDTDGDGVPDYMDKQLITPTECQPVDADGVGKCPCPDGCGSQVTSTCSNIPAAMIGFDANSSKIKPAAQTQLSVMAAQMQANPTCKVVVIGNGNGSKVQQQRSWDRVNAIIEYMSEKNGIDRGRFIFQYGQAGDANSVMIRAAAPDEEGPTNVPPPFPNLKK